MKIEEKSACILLDAAETIRDRKDKYGNAQDNFTHIAAIWNEIFQTKIFDAEKVAIAMIGLKIARMKQTPGLRDSLIDICGYAALIEDLHDER